MLPLSAQVFHILLALMDAERHGYAILKAVETQSDGHVILSTGTLYAAIKRLLADGLITEVAQPLSNGDARRRYYRITAFGREVAQAEVTRMNDLIRVAQRFHLRPAPSHSRANL